MSHTRTSNTNRCVFVDLFFRFLLTDRNLESCSQYSMLQCAALWQYAAVCCSVPECMAVCCSALQCAVACCSVLWRVAVCCTHVKSGIPAWSTHQTRPCDTHTRARAHTHIHTQTHARTHTHKNTHTHTHENPCKQTSVCVCLSGCVHVCVRVICVLLFQGVCVRACVVVFRKKKQHREKVRDFERVCVCGLF